MFGVIAPMTDTLLQPCLDFAHYVKVFKLAITEAYMKVLDKLGPNETIPVPADDEIKIIMEQCEKWNVEASLITAVILFMVNEVRCELIAARKKTHPPTS